MHDFRSDTMTRPTSSMRAAMAAAEVGDDVWGEDPTVRALEEAGAAELGKEAAVFTPSGTMANQIAIHVHCRPGDELICEQRSHVYYYEGGSIARLSGTQVRLLDCKDGFPTAAQIFVAVRVDNVHFPRSRLLVLENTHNLAGGRIASVELMCELADAAHKLGLLVHVDGARLANAAVALGCKMRDLVAAVDTTTLCLSKGLGAPVGSLLAGPAPFLAEARRARKAFGGGMRQAGILAAAGLIALREGPLLLADDHRRARELATGLAVLPGFRVMPELVDTNIVMVDLVGIEPKSLLAFLRDGAVLAAEAGPNRVRFVTHRDVSDLAVRACLKAAAEFCARAANL
ncbi:MAG: aminotransferase class I/II-fold pyridoxal phosphate-dependent enzyme [Planctomycetes bacterium]|nr:aminotransferase class I/II-fold pyridoxal phosphate-dependent enzyme [Planctomycetota bacterium]